MRAGLNQPEDDVEAGLLHCTARHRDTVLWLRLVIITILHAARLPKAASGAGLSGRIRCASMQANEGHA